MRTAIPVLNIEDLHAGVIQYDRTNTLQWDGSTMWYVSSDGMGSILSGAKLEDFDEIPEPDGQPWKGMYEAGERRIKEMDEELNFLAQKPEPVPGTKTADVAGEIAKIDALARLVKEL